MESVLDEQYDYPVGHVVSFRWENPNTFAVSHSHNASNTGGTRHGSSGAMSRVKAHKSWHHLAQMYTL